jgi:hypothetical protein
MDDPTLMTNEYIETFKPIPTLEEFVPETDRLTKISRAQREVIAAAKAWRGFVAGDRQYEYAKSLQRLFDAVDALNALGD